MHRILSVVGVAVLTASPAAATKLPSADAGLLQGAVFSNLPAIVSPPSSFSGGNLVVNGSFETGDFSGWSQENDTSFTFVTNELAGGGPTDGEFHAAFGPVDPGGGGIIQQIATSPGGIYQLSFDLANLGGDPNAFGLFWDGGFVSIDFDFPAFDYTSFSTVLTASGSDTSLGFFFYHEPSFWLLDNVSLGVIPEPATWGMMIAGFGLVGASLRRRSRIAAAAN